MLCGHHDMWLLLSQISFIGDARWYSGFPRTTHLHTSLLMDTPESQNFPSTPRADALIAVCHIVGGSISNDAASDMLVKRAKKMSSSPSREFDLADGTTDGLSESLVDDPNLSLEAPLGKTNVRSYGRTRDDVFVFAAAGCCLIFVLLVGLGIGMSVQGTDKNAEASGIVAPTEDPSQKNASALAEYSALEVAALGVVAPPWINLPDADVCVSAYDALCTGSVNSGMFQGTADRSDARLINVIKNGLLGSSAEHLFEACVSTPAGHIHVSGLPAQLFEVGLSVHGLFVSAERNPFLPYSPIRAFAYTSLPRHGQNVALPYVDITELCQPFVSMLKAAMEATPYGALMDAGLFATNADDVCDALAKINFTETVSTDYTHAGSDPSACAHQVAASYANTANVEFVRAVDPSGRVFSKVDRLFSRLKSLFMARAQRGIMPKDSALFKRVVTKLSTLRLEPWDKPIVSPREPSLLTNYTEWVMDDRKREWLHNFDPEYCGLPMLSYEVNACYVSSDNAVTIPTAIAMLVPPDDLGILNFMYDATLGFIVAHEIAHALGPGPIHYDSVGNYDPIELTESYEDSVSCMLRLAAAARLHPNQTVNEIFADMVGAEIAANLLPGSPYFSSAINSARLLSLHGASEVWVRSVALPWCGSARSATGSRRAHTVMYDPHPPNPFRLNTTLSGLDVFSNAFDCDSERAARCAYFF